MNEIKFYRIVLVALLISNVFLIAFALKPQKPRLRPEDQPKQIIINRLHFNASQVEEYESIISNHQQKIIRIEDDIHKTKKELFEILDADETLKKDSLIDVLAHLQADIEQIHFQHFIDIKNICNPEQLKYYEKLTHDLNRIFSRKARR